MNRYYLQKKSQYGLDFIKIPVQFKLYNTMQNMSRYHNKTPNLIKFCVVPLLFLPVNLSEHY